MTQVSSLDDNALFTAASYIRRRTQGAGQLIILTHNFAFFREMRNWLRNLKGQRKKDQGRRPAQFYMLRCNATDGIRRSRLRNLDRLLAQYQSEYHYLFSRIYRAANTPVNEWKTTTRSQTLRVGSLRRFWPSSIRSPQPLGEGTQPGFRRSQERSDLALPKRVLPQRHDWRTTA